MAWGLATIAEAMKSLIFPIRLPLQKDDLLARHSHPCLLHPYHYRHRIDDPIEPFSTEEVEP